MGISLFIGLVEDIYIYIYITTSLVLEETKLMSDSFQGDPISSFIEQNDPPFSTELRAFPVLSRMENFLKCVFSYNNSTFSYLHLFPPHTGAKYCRQIIV